MTTKAKLIIEIEEMAKNSIGKTWKINPLNFYHGYRSRTKSELETIKTELIRQNEIFENNKLKVSV